MRPVNLLFCFVSLLVVVGCTARYVPLNDPALKPFSSMYAIDRAQYGMSPLPTDGRVRIERREGKEAEEYGYDVMLHIYDKATRHVAFRRHDGGYRWVGEAEICTGPRVYESPDGRLNEQLIVSYFDGVVHQQDGLSIRYFGPDERLKQELPILTVKSVLVEWGCGS